MKAISAILFCMFVSILVSAQSLETPFEQSGGKATVTYQQGIRWWKTLSRQFPKEVRMMTMGMTDSGYPLNLVVISRDGNFNFSSLHDKNTCLILINNAIHPGEPDGVDASMLLAKGLVTGKIPLSSQVVLAIIPFYNIGGVLNRGSFSRANQNGPEAYGFRGNAQNLDLNRDFIKSDSKNALSFAEIFHLVDPDIFIDNHVSDGADYQHVMTLLTTQHDKLGGEAGAYLNDQMEPGIYSLMKQKGYDLVPYVNDFAQTPDSGWEAFYDSPRYSSGYTALFSCFGFMPETHMLKPYSQRVASDSALMQSFIEFAAAHYSEIRSIRSQAKQKVKGQTSFPLSWKVNRSHYSWIDFKGYAAGYKTSAVSGLSRLYYDHSRPYERKVPFYNSYLATDSVQKPDAYLIPQGWWNVISILKANGVKMERFSKDTTLILGIYHIDSYKSSTRPYEKHHFNYDVKVSEKPGPIRMLKGDYFIPLDQEANRYLMETLEPTGEDGFFSWNFFDAILQSKEGYSDYVFEDLAAGYLKDHPELRDSLEQLKKTDPGFADNARAQLDWVYKHSPWFEPQYLRYPVYRYEGNLQKTSFLFLNH